MFKFAVSLVSLKMLSLKPHWALVTLNSSISHLDVSAHSPPAKANPTSDAKSPLGDRGHNPISISK